MPNTAPVNGTLYAVFSGAGPIATALAATDRIFSCKTSSFKCDVDLPDVSTKESAGWAQHLEGGGLKNWSIDFSGIWNEAGTATSLTLAEIMALIIAGNVMRKVAFCPAALGTATVGWSGMGSFKGMTFEALMEAPCTFSGSIVGSGPVAVFTT